MNHYPTWGFCAVC